jgi:Sap-like sulfolipid-1-addressing protein
VARPSPGRRRDAGARLEADGRRVQRRQGRRRRVRALRALNPKNILLTGAAAAEIAEVGLSASNEAVVLAAFVVIASVGVLTPLVLALALGDRSRDVLDGLRGWMARNNAVIMAVLFLLIGAKLVGGSIAGLSS